MGGRETVAGGALVPARGRRDQTAAAAFLFHQLLAWPPHEDEALPLFIGRHPLDQMFQVVLEERGGAPLHFLLAWAVAHLELGLGGLRAVSAFSRSRASPWSRSCWRGSAGGSRAGRDAARRDQLDVSLPRCLRPHVQPLPLHEPASPISRCSPHSSAAAAGLGALGAGDPRHRRDPSLRRARARVAGAFVVVARRDRLRGAIWAFGAVAVLGIPFWLTDLVLAGRFDAGVAAGSRPGRRRLRLAVGGRLHRRLPGRCRLCSWRWRPGWPCSRARRECWRRACPIVPLAALVVARSTGSPETRHLIFLLPFVALAAGAGIARLGRVWGSAALGRARGRAARLDVGPDARAVRVGAGRPPGGPRGRSRIHRGDDESDDVLLGYDPLFLQAWERNPKVPLVVLPRADADLALHSLLSLERPLGHGIWVLDSSKTTNIERSLRDSARVTTARVGVRGRGTSGRSSSSARASPW